MDKIIGKKGAALLLVLVSVLAIFAAGCTSPTPAANNATTTTKSTIVAMTISDPPSLDPGIEWDTGCSGVTQNVYETLVFYEGAGTQKTVPLLATSWSSDSNYTVWTFKLRENVKFQDGTAFNASAVKYSMDRGVLINYADGPFAGVITAFLKGGPEWLASNHTRADADAYLAAEGVKVIDENTIQITLSKPFPEFPKIMAFSATAIVSPAFSEKNGGYVINDYQNTSALKEQMCGTGPFKFTSWAHEDRIILDKNTEYWGTQAKTDRVVLRNVPDLNTRLLALEKGEADLSQERISDYAQIKNLSNVVVYFGNETPNVDFFGFYCGRYPFNDSRVRQAFIESFDYDTFKTNVVYGYGSIPTGCIPPGVSMYNSNIPRNQYNATHARELLVEAGFNKSKPVTINLAYNKGNTRREAQCVMMKDQIEKYDLGIDVNVQSYAWATILDKQRKGEIDMFALGWLADYPTGDDFLGPFAVSDINYARQVAYKNDTIDDLYYNHYFNASSEAERQAIADEIQMGMYDDNAYAFLYITPTVNVYNKNLKGFEWNALDGEFRYQNMSK